MEMDNWIIIGYIAGIFLFFILGLISTYFKPVKKEEAADKSGFIAFASLFWFPVVILTIILAPFRLFVYVNHQGLKRQRQREALNKINNKGK